MDSEERVQNLEGEFKLLKSEVKQTLSSVRDFLLDFKLPTLVEAKPTPIEQDISSSDQSANQSNQEEANQPQGGDDNNGGSGGDGSGGSGESDSAYSEPEPEMAPAMENTEPEVIDSVDNDLAELDAEDTGISSGDMPSDEEPQDEKQESTEENLPDPAPAPMAYTSTAPQVNMLANLIRWAAEARREIGMAQLPVFLDVYATSGHLTEEMKENILHLAEVAADPIANEDAGGSGKVINEQLSICMEIGSFCGDIPAELRTKIRRLSELVLQQNNYANKADTWSQMMLKLHGILLNGGSPVQPVSFAKNAVKEEAAEDIDVPMDSVSEDEDGDFFTEEIFPEVSSEIEDESEEEIGPPSKNSRPAKLRLVMPVGDGAEQELDLGNLFIAADSKKKGNGHKKVSIPKR